LHPETQVAQAAPPVEVKQRGHLKLKASLHLQPKPPVNPKPLQTALLPAPTPLVTTWSALTVSLISRTRFSDRLPNFRETPT
jgi:hypothetical protein